jgi:para-aminobenzoate synthetase/4-amino-4-deoxychorismate lyase
MMGGPMTRATAHSGPPAVRSRSYDPGPWGPETHTVLLREAAADRWLLFRKPVRILEAHRVEEVLPALGEVDRLVREEGWHAAGFLGYEAAPALDRALVTLPPAEGMPLLWFGIYPEPAVVDLPSPSPLEEAAPRRWKPSVSQREFARAIRRVKERIARGDTYQVNYTYRLRTPFPLLPWPFFLRLCRSQGAGYAAFVDTGRFAVLSASPELFFTLEEGRILSRPMKGTAARGLTAREDEANAASLHASPKDRAENLMIVDMVRNDLGRIALPGTVRVPALFAVERYPTVWQMTSTVVGETRASLPGIMTALFPCASITGAPKASTMAIIAGLETAPRQLYTGAIGYWSPGPRAQFNVAIRTVLVDRRTRRAEYGVGGGILWYSTARGEYRECQVKSRILTEPPRSFSLLETMLWTPREGFVLLDYHLRRLLASARFFGFPAAERDLRRRLQHLVAGLPAVPRRVRLLVSRTGEVALEHAPHDQAGDARPVHLALAALPVAPEDLFLYHKTTRRRVYDEALARAPDADDVLLWNTRGELTETCRSNLVLELEGEILTPPVACGLLPGTHRQWLLDRGLVRERVLPREVLGRASRIWVVNSLRGLREAVFPAADGSAPPFPRGHRAPRR